MGVAVKSVASAPNCDHTIVSLAPKAPRLVTTATLSARAAAVANRIRTIAAAEAAQRRLMHRCPHLVSALSGAHEVLEAYWPASEVKRGVV